MKQSLALKKLKTTLDYLFANLGQKLFFQQLYKFVLALNDPSLKKEIDQLKRAADNQKKYVSNLEKKAKEELEALQKKILSYAEKSNSTEISKKLSLLFADNDSLFKYDELVGLFFTIETLLRDLMKIPEHDKFVESLVNPKGFERFYNPSVSKHYTDLGKEHQKLRKQLPWLSLQRLLHFQDEHDSKNPEIMWVILGKYDEKRDLKQFLPDEYKAYAQNLYDYLADCANKKIHEKVLISQGDIKVEKNHLYIKDKSMKCATNKGPIILLAKFAKNIHEKVNAKKWHTSLNSQQKNILSTYKELDDPLDAKEKRQLRDSIDKLNKRIEKKFGTSSLLMFNGESIYMNPENIKP